MLTLPTSLGAWLEATVRRGYPHETCGLLVGRPEAGGAVVTRVVEARNLNQARARDRYELDPEDFLKTDVAARAEGLEIVGIWHSHPDHPAVPSETDRAAAWEGWSYVILSVSRAGVQDLRSWRLVREAFDEEPVSPPWARSESNAEATR